VLFDRRQALEVALDARRELVALGLQQPELSLLARPGTRLAGPRACPADETWPLRGDEDDDRCREQGDEEPAHASILDSRPRTVASGLRYSRGLRVAVLSVLAVLAAALHPGGARAAEQTLVFRSAAITIPGYGVAQSYQLVPSPSFDGYVTSMSADVVDAKGTSVPITRVMLHHVVFAKLGTPDATCSTFRDYDNRVSSVPVERFYGAGEERATLELPPGYGYPNRGSDHWGLVYMLMNHKPATRTVYVQYTVRYVSGESLTPVRPYWLDVRNCRADPIFDVPGTGPMFSTFSRSVTFTMPESGRIVAAGGHLHGGGLRLDLTDDTCGSRLFTSEPTWGLPLVKPVVHEPGPKHMTEVSTAAGIPVSAGDRLRLTAVYDNSRPHTRVMGIMLVFVAPGPVAHCGPAPALPRDPLSHPSAPPRVTIPLFRQPVGPWERVLAAQVGDFAYSAPRVVLRRGSTFRWRFAGPSRHDVTLASGPVGFSSPSVASGSFSFRFTKPGVYRLYCSLHPTTMTQIVTVR
jgi:plastocyanin